MDKNGTSFLGWPRRLALALIFVVGLVVTILVAGEALLSAGSALRRWISPSTGVFPDPSKMAIYQGKEWAADYWPEDHASARVSWEPYVMWRRVPFTGKTINVGPDRNRVTWRPEAVPEGVEPYRVWMFGGSTMWSSGAPDWETVPSQFAKVLAGRDIHVEAINYGETGFVTTQELILLLRELATGEKPDLVVFFDGYNDTFTAYQQRVPGITANEHNRRFEFNVRMKPEVMAGEVADRYLPHWTHAYKRIKQGWQNLTGGKPAATGAIEEYYPLNHHEYPMDAAESKALADGTVNAYENNIYYAAEICRSRDIPVLAYWQPWIRDKNIFTDDEKAVYAAVERVYPGVAEFSDLVAEALKNSRIAKEPYFRDISGAFRDRPEGYFYDQVHVTGEGNLILAELMARDAAPLLTKRER